MAEATLSILGLMAWDSTKIWEGFRVPDGMDRQLAIDSIVLECADIELLFPAYEQCRFAITTWTNRRFPIWEKLYATTQLEYNPIENYDRMEDWQDNTVFKGKTDSTRTGKDTGETSGHTDGTDTALNVHSVKGFDSANFVGAEQDDGINTSEADSTGHSEINRAETGVENRNDNTNMTRRGRAHGNIGVTTTQDMIRQEREVDDWEIYMYIVNDFKNDLCLGVY